MNKRYILWYLAWIIAASAMHNWFLAGLLGVELSGAALAAASLLVLYILIEKT